MGYYQSPRWTNEIADCSMPMTFDTYSNCSFGCLYCFSQFQRAIGNGKENYLQKSVENVNPKKIMQMFSDPDKYAGQFAPYIKQRRVMQWGVCLMSLTDMSASLALRWNCSGSLRKSIIRYAFQRRQHGSRRMSGIWN